MTTAERKRRVEFIGPNPGPQTAFLESEADIVVYGGQAGGGKTFGLLLSPMPYRNEPGFGGVIFRRTSPQITNEGGIWDESMSLYSLVGGIPRTSKRQWRFKSKSAITSISFRHLQHDKDKFSWMGASVCFLGFDELTHFTESQFFYLLSRNRSTCGVKPFVRATCNPIPDDDPIGGWVHRLLQWWIDPVTGFAIPERSGKIRWMIRRDNEFHFDDSKDALFNRFRHRDLPDDHPKQPKPKSLTFIHAALSDNPKMAEKDPDYEANLELLAEHERKKLQEGNWNAKLLAGLFFKVGKIEIVDSLPADLSYCRGWDLAATDGAGDWTVGAKVGEGRDGFFYIADIVRGQWESNYRDGRIRTTADLDNCIVRFPQDPGAAGKTESKRLVRMLAGHNVRSRQVNGDKPTRAAGFASQLNAGNVRMLRAPWNAGLVSRLDSFPTKGIPDDEIDALADAFNELTRFRRTAAIAVGTRNEAEHDEPKKSHPFGALVDDDDDKE